MRPTKPFPERRKKQLGELIRFRGDKQCVRVTPKEFVKIVDKPGPNSIHWEKNLQIIRIGNDKEIIARRIGKKAVIFEERRIIAGGIGAKLKPALPSKKEKMVAQLPEEIRKRLLSKNPEKEAAEKIAKNTNKK